MHTFTKKLPIVIVVALMFAGWAISSCKKENQSTLNSFLTDNGLWKLASLRVETLHNDTSIRFDTLNVACQHTQSFMFDAGGTCTYNYFNCLDQVTQGPWTINAGDIITLSSTMKCKDTTKAGVSTPFAQVQVINLGRNSLVFQDVKTDTLRKSPRIVLRRRITRYGFIH
ncbi:hypothetical protein [Mucilaginibacter sp. CSA2-8R]|uniref:hypothetical protein n=1 Tax=Mucilaginibacter sp. CSA2-8R TaxID=3141542 RepID=UPI00315D6078